MSFKILIFPLIALLLLAPVGAIAATAAPAPGDAGRAALNARPAGPRTVARQMAVAGHSFARNRAVARRKAAATREKAQLAAVPPQLQAIAQCESGGNPSAIGGGGLYRGLFQFNRQTWASVGGAGDPAAASVAEQYKRAAILYARSGAGQWPVCGR